MGCPARHSLRSDGRSTDNACNASSTPALASDSLAPCRSGALMVSSWGQSSRAGMVVRPSSKHRRKLLLRRFGRGLRHVELLLVLDLRFERLFVELQTGEKLDITRRAADIRHSRAGRSRPGLEVEPGSRKLPLRVGFIVEAALIGGLKA